MADKADAMSISFCFAKQNANEQNARDWTKMRNACRTPNYDVRLPKSSAISPSSSRGSE